MIITDKYIIGHIPKTGGRALTQMLKDAGEIILPISNKISAHATFDQYPDLLKNRQLYLILRRLPNWLLSRLWQESMSTIIIDSVVKRYKKTQKSYTKEMKARKGFMLLTRFLANSTYPDYQLKLHTNINQKIIFLRQEYLIKDVKLYLSITLTPISKEIYSHANKPNTKKYWRLNEHLKLLYANNPVWAKKEKELYGDNILTFTS